MSTYNGRDVVEVKEYATQNGKTRYGVVYIAGVKDGKKYVRHAFVKKNVADILVKNGALKQFYEMGTKQRRKKVSWEHDRNLMPYDDLDVPIDKIDEEGHFIPEKRIWLKKRNIRKSKYYEYEKPTRFTKTSKAYKNALKVREANPREEGYRELNWKYMYTPRQTAKVLAAMEDANDNSNYLARRKDILDYAHENGMRVEKRLLDYLKKDRHFLIQKGTLNKLFAAAAVLKKKTITLNMYRHFSGKIEHGPAARPANYVDDMSIEEVSVPVKRGRGRPKGSSSKGKEKASSSSDIVLAPGGIPPGLRHMRGIKASGKTGKYTYLKKDGERSKPMTPKKLLALYKD